MNNSGEP